MYFSKEELNAAKAMIPKSNKKRICMNIESKDLNRCWDRKNFIELIKSLCKNYQIVLLGTNQDYNKSITDKFKKEIVNLVGKTSIRETAVIIKESELYIGNDSGLSHVSAAVNTNLINIMLGSKVDILNDEKKSKVVKLKKPNVKRVLKTTKMFLE